MPTERRVFKLEHNEGGRRTPRITTEVTITAEHGRFTDGRRRKQAIKKALENPEAVLREVGE